jgi:hypothetical protein
MTRMGTQGVGDHHRDEIVGRHLTDGGLLIVRGPGVHEQHVEPSARQPVAQRGQLSGFVDVQDLDVETAVAGVAQVVQRGVRGPSPDGADDVPAVLEELGGHGVAEAREAPTIRTVGAESGGGAGGTGVPCVEWWRAETCVHGEGQAPSMVRLLPPAHQGCLSQA